MANLSEILAGNEGGKFYIPIATNDSEGIAKFYETHFTVIDGEVRIEQEYFRSLFAEFLDAKVEEVTRDRIRAEFNNLLLLTDDFGGYGVALGLLRANEREEEPELITYTVLPFPSLEHLENVVKSLQNQFETKLTEYKQQIDGELLSYKNEIDKALGSYINDVDVLIGGD